MSVSGTNVPESVKGRHADRVLVTGIALLIAPMVLYPGNWTNGGPVTPGSQQMWEGVGTVVFLPIAVGATITLVALRRLFRSWAGFGHDTLRKSLADAAVGRSGRIALGSTAVAYTVVVGSYLGLYGWSVGGPGVWESSYPTATNVLCCGPVGVTPVGILMITSTFELVAYPVVLVTVFLAALLFPLIVAVATSLVRSRSMGPALGGTILGATSALRVNCRTF